MKKAWWKESVVYQIYPRSFYDSNGDGIGDLRGIIEKLDYLRDLGIDVVWLSPVYRSPNDDNGYDISDYRDIHPDFGTLADWQEMLAEMHRRGIRLVMDLVVNHTSDEHPWFSEARKSKVNPYRDFYVWRPPRDGREPNNWASAFGGSAWQYDAATGEYYLHIFSQKQPDLNWENPRVRAEVYDMMRWWLEKGVDGFRMDVINLISKVQTFADVPNVLPGHYQMPNEFIVHGPRLIEFLQEMKREVLSQYDILTVGETPLATTAHAAEITDEETGALNMVFQFDHMEMDAEPGKPAHMSNVPWRLQDLKSIMTRWERDLAHGGWNSLYLDNHDQPRAVSHFGDDTRYRVASAKLLATFLHMLQGTPYVYQGEEIGMTNVAFESIDDYEDIETRGFYREMVETLGMDPSKALAVVHAKSRDNARTPVQWDGTPQAGFTTGKPWLRVNPNYATINVSQALADPDSVFYYYRRLIRLRRENPVMVYGNYDLILPDHERIYAFTRTLDRDRLLVMLNFSGEAPIFELPGDFSPAETELLIANYPVDPGEDIRRIPLRPWEARVYRLR